MKTITSLFLSFLFISGSFFVFTSLAYSAPPANSLIKASGDAVYFLGEDNKRYAFPNEKIYATWYKDFSSVINISDTELASYQLGGNIFYRPGTRLIKITSDPKVYAVEPDGALSPIPDEATAIALFGPDWNKRVDDLSDAFFSGYTIQSNLSASQHPEGTVFNYAGQSSFLVLQKDDAGIMRAHSISQEQLQLFGFSQSHILSIATSFAYPTGNPIDTLTTTLNIPTQKSTTTSPPPPITETHPDSADLVFHNIAEVAGETTGVQGDGGAILYGFSIDGDDDATATLKEITLRFYIDAGGENDGDEDYVLGSDNDGLVTWPVSQVVRDIRLANAETGKEYTTGVSVTSSGVVTLRPNAEIPANTTVKFYVLGLVSIAPQLETKVSLDFHPVNDVVFSTNASTLSVSPSQFMNNETHPGSWILLQKQGKLIISSSPTSVTGFQPLGEELLVYKLSLYATGEDFSIKTTSLGMSSDGNVANAVNELELRYTNSNGNQETEPFSELGTDTVFKFPTSDIYVPKNKSVSVNVYATSHPQEDLYSNARLQFEFRTKDFFAEGLTSGEVFDVGAFANENKLVDDTDEGNLIILREGNLMITPGPTTPSGIINKQNKATVLTFSVKALKERITIKKLTFQLTTSDVDKDGDDNDILEKIANGFPQSAFGLYSYHEDKDERTLFLPQSMTFGIGNGNGNFIDTTPDGLQTQLKDYGVFIYEFGGSGISVEEGNTLSFMVDLDTTLASTEEETSLQLKLLGDKQNTSTSEANFLWDDGSNKPATGYLIQGLDHFGGSIVIPR